MLKCFKLMDANVDRYVKEAVNRITMINQQQHDRQLNGLQNEIASLKTAVNRLERALTSNNTQQQTPNKQTTPANNTTQNTQQDRGHSRARTPNSERQPSQRQPSQRRNRGASTSRRHVTYADISSLPPTANQTATPPRKKTPTKLITQIYPKTGREIIVSFREPMTFPAD
jgi:chromosome segregation ATPase